jgi:hypothetical protein
MLTCLILIYFFYNFSRNFLEAMNFTFQWGHTVTTSDWLRCEHSVMGASASTHTWNPSACRICRPRAPRGLGVQWRAGVPKDVSTGCLAQWMMQSAPTLSLQELSRVRFCCSRRRGQQSVSGAAGCGRAPTGSEHVSQYRRVRWSSPVHPWQHAVRGETWGRGRRLRGWLWRAPRVRD